jgi:hypothetical protein
VDGKEHRAAQAFNPTRVASGIEISHAPFRGRAYRKALPGSGTARHRLVAPRDRIVVHWFGLRMPADT